VLHAASIAGPLLSAALALIALGAPPASRPGAQLDDRGPAPRAELEAFASDLRRLRRGEEQALVPLRERAARLAEYGREDAGTVLAFYAALPRDDRARGLAAEERFEALWDEVRRSGGLAEEPWRARRAEVLGELERIAAEEREAPDPTPAARCLSLAARILEQQAREDPALSEERRLALLRTAEEHALAALAIFERAGMLTPGLEPMWLLARLDDARGAASDARRGYEDCLDLAQRVDNTDFQRHALRGLVALCERAGDVDGQRARVRDAARLFGADGEWWIARQWAELLIGDDEPAAAAALLARSRPSAPGELAQWHLLFGSALLRERKEPEARAHFEEARSLAERPGAVRLEAALASARAAILAGEPARALAALDAAESTRPSEATRARMHALRGAAQRAEGRLTEAEQSLRAALAEAEGLEARLEGAQRAGVFGEVAGLETVALLADVLARQGRGFEAARVAEEFQARALRGEHATHVDEPSLRAWAAAYDGGLLTWVIGADTSVAIHVTADGDGAAEVLAFGREALRDATRRVREAAIAGNGTRALALAAEVEAGVLPEALRARIARAERVLCLAHGPLEDLAFDLLPSFSGATRALVLPGLPEHSPGDPTAAWAWSVLGDPASQGKESILPGAREEARAVAALHGTEALSGARFDRAAFEAALASGRALHVATHLVPASAAGGSDGAGLVVADGEFRVREIRAREPRLPLAVLTACETAGGEYRDAQPLVSVANAFLAGGTRNVCVTLWPVEDRAARDWAQAFHAALAEGQMPSAAARAAREALRARGVSVAEWAAFRLAGRD
jgi:hypothetical protein